MPCSSCSNLRRQRFCDQLVLARSHRDYDRRAVVAEPIGRDHSLSPTCFRLVTPLVHDLPELRKIRRQVEVPPLPCSGLFDRQDNGRPGKPVLAAGAGETCLRKLEAAVVYNHRVCGVEKMLKDNSGRVDGWWGKTEEWNEGGSAEVREKGSE